MDDKRTKRHKRIRAKMKGTAEVPRLCVFRSNKHVYGQLIDDEKGKTILSSSDFELKKSKIKSQKLKIAHEIGKLLAKKAMEKKIEKIVFDRGGYKYHGRIKALADGAREGGLKF
jgi:large subunit ribosomal protein L18